MRQNGEIVGAVDFGSRRIRVAIARQEEDGTAQIIGFGDAPSHGCVYQGVIQDLNATQVALKSALADAEKDARLRVPALFCGINGKNVETFLREGHVKLEDEVVEQHHMDEALDLASRDVLEAGKRVVSSIAAQEWYVDDLRVLDPRGINGHVLKTRVHFARIPSVIEDNIVQCVESQKRELEDIIFMPLAAALGTLTPEDRELGVAVLDMGRTNTGLAVFRDRRILGTQCFEWGGYHLTRDVAAGLHISFEEADELILEYGIADDFVAAEEDTRETAAAVGETYLPHRQKTQGQLKLKTAVHGARSIVGREEFDMIVCERAHELMVKVRQHFQSRGLVKHLVRGVVLTGGAAHIKNFVGLAETVFGVPCRVGMPLSMEILPNAAKSPDCSGVVGIAKHGLEYRTATRTGRLLSRGPIVSTVQRVYNAARKYFV